MRYQNILLEQPEAGIFRLTVNRPKVLNALNAATLDEVAAALSKVAGDDAARVLLLTGVIDPGGVYNHPDAVANPWKWAGIHGFFVTLAGAAAVAAWRLNETVRAEAAEAHRQTQLAAEKLAFQALHDELTGLPNRRSLFADLERTLPEATEESPLVLELPPAFSGLMSRSPAMQGIFEVCRRVAPTDAPVQDPECVQRGNRVGPDPTVPLSPSVVESASRVTLRL